MKGLLGEFWFWVLVAVVGGLIVWAGTSFASQFRKRDSESVPVYVASAGIEAPKPKVLFRRGPAYYVPTKYLKNELQPVCVAFVWVKNVGSATARRVSVYFDTPVSHLQTSPSIKFLHNGGNVELQDIGAGEEIRLAFSAPMALLEIRISYDGEIAEEARQSTWEVR